MVAANPRNLLPNCLIGSQDDVFPYRNIYKYIFMRQSFPYKMIVRERIRENPVKPSRKTYKVLIK